MTKCNLGKKWSSNLEELPDWELDSLIDHSSVCSFHADILTDYERSILPILRAALPEKVVAYQPRLVHEKGYLWHLLTATNSSIRTYLRRSMIRDYVSNVRSRASARPLPLPRARTEPWSRSLKVLPASKSFAGVVFLLVFLTLFGGALGFFLTNRNLAPKTESAVPFVIEEQTMQLSPPPVIVNKREEAGIGASGSVAVPIVQPQSSGPDRDVIVSIGDNEDLEDKDGASDKKDNVEKTDVNLPDNVRKTLQDEALRTPDAERKSPNPRKLLVLSLKDDPGPYHAKVIIRITNLSKQEIKHPQTLCEAFKKNSPRSIVSSMTVVEEANKVTGVCVFGLPFSEDYKITVNSNGYDQADVNVTVDKAGEPLVILTMLKSIKLDSMIDRRRY